MYNLIYIHISVYIYNYIYTLFRSQTLRTTLWLHYTDCTAIQGLETKLFGVWKNTSGLGRVVAVKIIGTHYARDLEWVGEFRVTRMMTGIWVLKKIHRRRNNSECWANTVQRRYHLWLAANDRVEALKNCRVLYCAQLNSQGSSTS